MMHPDDHGHKGAHMNDHVMLENAHPHVEHTQSILREEDPDVNPNRKAWDASSRSMTDGVPHGRHNTIIHDRRDKGPEHHPPTGLMNHQAAPADNSGNY